MEYVARTCDGWRTRRTRRLGEAKSTSWWKLFGDAYRARTRRCKAKYASMSIADLWAMERGEFEAYGPCRLPCGNPDTSEVEDALHIRVNERLDLSECALVGSVRHGGRTMMAIETFKRAELIELLGENEPDLAAMVAACADVVLPLCTVRALVDHKDRRDRHLRAISDDEDGLDYPSYEALRKGLANDLGEIEWFVRDHQDEARRAAEAAELARFRSTRSVARTQACHQMTTLPRGRASRRARTLARKAASSTGGDSDSDSDGPRPRVPSELEEVAR